MKKFISDYKILYLIPLLLVFALIYKFYLSQGTWQFFEYNQGQFYNWLAQGFLEGRLGVAKDVVSGHGGSFGDGISLNGQIYLPFGPFPAVIHAVAIILTGKGIMGTTLTYWVSLLNLTIFWALLVNVSKIFFKKISLWVLVPIFISYASGTIMFNLGRGYIYEEAIIFSSTLFLTSILSLTFAQIYEQKRSFFIFSSGLFFSFAFLSRFNYILYGPMLILYLLIFAGVSFKLSLKKDYLLSIVKKLAIFLLPILLFFCVQLAYNYERFGSFTDLGNKHQSVVDTFVNPRMSQLISLRYISYNFLNYFFAPIHISKQGKVIFSYFPGTIGNFPKIVPTEWTSSIFLSAPILFFSLASLWFLFKRRDVQISFFVASTILGLAFFLTFGLFIFLGNALRYTQDFLPLLYILAFLPLTILAINLRKTLLTALTLVLIFLSFYSFYISAHKTCFAWVGKYTNNKDCGKFYRPATDFIPLS